MSKLMFAHRYKHSHVKRRKLLRRLTKDGVTELVERTNDGWLYRVPDNVAERKM